MNAYTTMGQARITQRDIDGVLRAHSYLAGATLAALERERGCQAEAEMARLLKQHGLQPASVISRLSMLRQTLGAALIRVGERLAGASPGAATPEPAAAARRVGVAG
jgi:hypothetical protein